MTYKIDGKAMLFAISRVQIVSVSAGDRLQVEGLPGAEYQWTEQDSEFVENNPDDDIFLQVERTGENKYKATGILLRQPVK
jgi:hypothetical protein